MGKLLFPSYFYERERLERRGGRFIAIGLHGSVYRMGEHAIKFFNHADLGQREWAYFEQELNAYGLLYRRTDIVGMIPQMLDYCIPHKNDKGIGSAVIVLDFVEGTGLYKIEPPDSKAFILRIQEELLAIVKSLHNAGVSHNDIRPENIVIRKSMQSEVPYDNHDDEKDNWKQREREDEEKDHTSKQPEKLANSCVLLDFGQALIQNNEHFEYAKRNDFDSVTRTVQAVRTRLFTTEALRCLGNDLSTSAAFEELLGYLKYADEMDYRWKSKLLGLEMDEPRLYAVASCVANMHDSMTFELYERAKTQFPDHNKLKWARACARNLYSSHEQEEAIRFLTKGLNDNFSRCKISNEDRLGIWMDLIEYHTECDLDYSLNAASHFLLDFWRDSCSARMPDADIESTLPSMMGCEPSCSVYHTQLAERLTLMMAKMLDKRYIESLDFEGRPTKTVWQRSKKIHRVSRSVIKSGVYRPSQETICTFGATLSADTVPDPVQLLAGSTVWSATDGQHVKST